MKTSTLPPGTARHARCLILLVCAALPLQASAHTSTGGHHWWTLDPWVWAPMLLIAGLYLRGIHALHAKHGTMRAARPYAIASFCAAMAASFLALIWPLDALGEISFAAHMAQHMMLIAVAAPLFSLAEPALPLLAAIPASWRRINSRLGALYKALRIVSRPRFAFALHGAIVWVWHAPLLFEWTLRWRWVHVIEHLAFLGSALLFWNAMRHATRVGTAALWVLATMMHTGLLGALITFAPRPLYPSYADIEGAVLSPMEDQQLAGLLMWIPAGLCYLVAGVGYAAAWLRSAENRTSA